MSKFGAENSWPRVLLVEDNRPLAENWAELLEELDVSVELTASAAEALAAAAKTKPDLAIVDVGLPDKSGITLLQEIHHHCPGTEVILVTGQATLQSAMDAIRLGAFGYLLKPVESESFLHLAERALAAVALRAERKRLAQMLADSEALHRTLVEAVDAAIVGVDSEGRVAFANGTARSLLSWDEEHSGGSFRSFFPDGDTPAHPEEGTPWVSQFGARRVRWTMSPIPSRSSLSAVAVGVDITEQEALRRRAAEQEALAAVGVLTAGLAHEIRNPLNAAQLQLELISRRSAKGVDVDDVQRRAALVRGELKRLTSLLDDFLGLARPKALGLQPMDMSRLLDDLIELESPICLRQGIRVTSDCPPGLLAHADRDQLSQALLNLIRNSREAFSAANLEEGSLCLSAQEDITTAGKRIVRVGVTDDGPGFPEGNILEPFHTTKAAGTGLGLSIVQKIVHAHGGELRLESPDGGGACVTFDLPARES
ncbi:MAG: signal transduction histidine kinase [Polyangiales bacterium]